LASVYSPAELQRFAHALGSTPAAVLGIDSSGDSISAAQLVELVRAHCRAGSITMAQFEDVVGWSLAGILESPEQLLQEISIHGLQWLCRELAVDWRRVILGL